MGILEEYPRVNQRNREDNQMTERICVQSLSDYNNGRLIYKWMDMDDFSNEEEFYTAIQTWLEGLGDDQYGQPREEWHFADWEGDCMSVFCSEHGLDDDYWTLLEVAENSHLELEVFLAGYEENIPLESIEDAYIGEFEDDIEYVEHLIEDGSIQIPEHLEIYINKEMLARDYTMDVYSNNGHYFNSSW